MLRSESSGLNLSKQEEDWEKEAEFNICEIEIKYI